MSLTNQEINRYGRQLLLEEVSIEGQLKLKAASVLVVGAGGLGAPSALYLAAAGVGRIGIVDYDCVDLSNLHRQIIHSECSIGKRKVDSAVEALRKLNSTIELEAIHVGLDSSNAIQIIQRFDVVLDASDNVPTRYLLNDSCVLLGKPLVSGSALRLEGQLTTYNFNNGPCFRCLFPVPPPRESVNNCNDVGVLGPITGVIGSLQALEAILIITLSAPNYSQKMLLFDGRSGQMRNITLRSKRPNCIACGESRALDGLVDYNEFCNSAFNDKGVSLQIIDSSKRVTCKEYSEISRSHTLIDCREIIQFKICSLNNSINCPISSFSNCVTKLGLSSDAEIFIVCRRGNDSQLAVNQLEEMGYTQVKDIIGGLQQWVLEVDPDFPLY